MHLGWRGRGPGCWPTANSRDRETLCCWTNSSGRGTGCWRSSRRDWVAARWTSSHGLVAGSWNSSCSRRVNSWSSSSSTVSGARNTSQTICCCRQVAKELDACKSCHKDKNPYQKLSQSCFVLIMYCTLSHMLGHVTSSANGQLYTIEINRNFLMRLLKKQLGLLATSLESRNILYLWNQ